MHIRAEFGHREADLSESKFASRVAEYLYECPGNNMNTMELYGVRTTKFLTVSIDNMDVYFDSLPVAQYLWEIGYFVMYFGPKIPGQGVKPVVGVTALLICWDNNIVGRKGNACPCWACPDDRSTKIECFGCENFRRWKPLAKSKV